MLNLSLWPKEEGLVEKTVQGEGENKILMIDISGIISGEGKRKFAGLIRTPSLPARIKEELKKAEKDPWIKAVILRINSLGGTVTASDIIRHEITRFRDKKKVPVIAALMDTATSGAYLVAVSADKIIAHPTTITGSIGVLVFKFSVKGLMEKIGIENETIFAGDKKMLLFPFEPLETKDRALLQEVIDYLHGRFKTAVTKGRAGLDEKQVEKLADGRVYNAKQALEKKLVDSIGYLDDAVELAEKEAGIERARLIMYQRPRGNKTNIYSQAGGIIGAGGGNEVGNAFNLINLDLGEITRNTGVQFMYLWSP
jgi:protease-4